MIEKAGNEIMSRKGTYARERINGNIGAGEHKS
jgi:hypothetical protein